MGKRGYPDFYTPPVGVTITRVDTGTINIDAGTQPVIDVVTERGRLLYLTIYVSAPKEVIRILCDGEIVDMASPEELALNGVGADGYPWALGYYYIDVAGRMRYRTPLTWAEGLSVQPDRPAPSAYTLRVEVVYEVIPRAV